MKYLPILLIVDDEKHTRDGLRRAMEDHFEIYVAADEASAFNMMESEKVDVVLTDLRLAGDNGMKILDKARSLQPAPICVMMTAYGSVENAVEAMRRGAYDYVTKPVNIDKLEMLLLRALKGRLVEDENRQLRQQLDEKFGLEKLIGRSAKMVQIFDLIRQVADSRASVLIP
jgi:DNA-binding NtrC family response regulator